MAIKETSLGKHLLWNIFDSLRTLIRHLGTEPRIYLGERQKKKSSGETFWLLLSLVVNSSSCPRSSRVFKSLWHVVSSHRWETAEEKYPGSAQKLKMKCYLFFLSLLGECGGGQSVPRSCATGNFQVFVFQCRSCKHTNPSAHPQPTCQRCSPVTQGDEGAPRGHPLAEPQAPDSLLKGCGTRQESAQEKAVSA